MQDWCKKPVLQSIKPFLVFFLILFLISSMVLSQNLVEPYNDPITYSMGDLRWCRLNGVCTFDTITTEAIITGNLSVIGQVFNVTMNLVTWNITESFNVGGNLVAKNITADYVGIGTSSPSHKLNVVGDVNITGTIINTDFTTLTDDSMADTLHRHSELSASDGTPDAVLSVDATGLVDITNTYMAGEGQLSIHGTTHAYLGLDSATNSDAGILLKENNVVKWDIFNSGDDGDKLKIYDDGNLRFTIQQDGKVGIGTGSPGSLLHLNNATATSVTLLTLESDINNADEYNEILFKIVGGLNYGAIRSHLGSVSDSYMTFSTTTNGGSLVQHMTIQHDGKIGFGTKNPGKKVEIYSSSPQLRIRDSGSTAGSSTGFIEFGGTDGGAWNRTGYIGDGSSGNLDLYFQAEYGDLHIGDSSGIVMNLQGGNVGIGTTTPTSELHIIGNLNVSESYYGNGSQLTDIQVEDIWVDESGDTMTGDLRIKDSDGEYHNVSRVLQITDEMNRNITLVGLNGTLDSGTGNVTITTLTGNNIIVNIDKNETILDKNSDSIIITSGTNESPIFNQIIYTNAGNPVLSKRTTLGLKAPSVAAFLQGANFTYASAIGLATINNFIGGLFNRLLRDGSTYRSGFEINVSTSMVNISTGVINLLLDEVEITSNHSTSNLYIHLHSDNTFHQHSALDTCASYNDGSAISNNKYYNAIFGIAITHDGTGVMYVITQNKPSTEYTKAIDAEVDIEDTINYFPSDDIVSLAYIPIVRVVMRRSGGTNTIQTLSNGMLYDDLRGTVTKTSSSPPPSGITVHSDLTNLDYASAGHTGFQNTTVNNTGYVNIGTVNMSEGCINNSCIDDWSEVNTTVHSLDDAYDDGSVIQVDESGAGIILNLSGETSFLDIYLGYPTGGTKGANFLIYDSVDDIHLLMVGQNGTFVGGAPAVQSISWYPFDDDTFDFGSPNKRWRNISISRYLTDGTNSLTVANAKTAYDFTTNGSFYLNNSIPTLMDNTSNITCIFNYDSLKWSCYYNGSVGVGTTYTGGANISLAGDVISINASCEDITGGSGLCDGTDDTGIFTNGTDINVTKLIVSTLSNCDTINTTSGGELVCGNDASGNGVDTTVNNTGYVNIGTLNSSELCINNSCIPDFSHINISGNGNGVTGLDTAYDGGENVIDVDTDDVVWNLTSTKNYTIREDNNREVFKVDYTGDTTLGQAVGDQMLGGRGDGTGNAPIYSFAEDSNTGVDMSSHGVVDIIGDGIRLWRVREAGTGGSQVQFGDDTHLGVENAPAYTWGYDANTGLWNDGVDSLFLGAGGQEFFHLKEDGSSDIAIFNDDGDNIDLRFETDTETNMFFVDGADNFINIAGGYGSTGVTIYDNGSLYMNGNLIIDGFCLSGGVDCASDIAELTHSKSSADNTSCNTILEHNETITHNYYNMIEEECKYQLIEDFYYYVCVNVTEQYEFQNISEICSDDYELVEDNKYKKVVNCVNETPTWTEEETITIPKRVECSLNPNFELEFESGDVVCIDETDPNHIKFCDKQYDTSVVGVINYNPTLIIGQRSPYPLSLTGNVPVKVQCSTPIEIGDLLVSSNVKGYAQSIKTVIPSTLNQVWNKIGSPFAKALESCNSGNKTIRAWI